MALSMLLMNWGELLVRPIFILNVGPWDSWAISSRGVYRISKKTEINDDIRDPQVRVIDAEGEQLGIMSSKEALEIASERKLDLVKIAPQADPPVCRIMDFGKHRYEQQKREKEARKKQKTVEMKEIRLSLNIEQHDIETKANTAAKFLEKGDKVKVSLRFKGRELGHSHLGIQVFEDFAKQVEHVGKMEKRPVVEGRSMLTIFVPLK